MRSTQDRVEDRGCCSALDLLRNGSPLRMKNIIPIIVDLQRDIFASSKKTGNRVKLDKTREVCFEFEAKQKPGQS